MAQQRHSSQPPQNMQQNQSSPLHMQQAMYMQQLQAQQMLAQQQSQQQQQHQYGRQGSPPAGTAQTPPQGRQGSATVQSPTVPIDHSRQASVSGFSGQYPHQQRESSAQSQAGPLQYARQSSVAPVSATAYSENGPFQQRTPTPVSAATTFEPSGQQQNHGLREQSPMSGSAQTRYHL
jgi:type II secretory pathway pseudopilin PulG